MLETKFYQENRKKLSEYMVDNSFYFVHSGSELESTYDECFLFEPYRNFLYLTGVSRPDALFVMTKIDGVVKYERLGRDSKQVSVYEKTII